MSSKALVTLMIMHSAPLSLNGKQTVQMYSRTVECVAQSIQNTKYRVEVAHDSRSVVAML